MASFSWDIWVAQEVFELCDLLHASGKRRLTGMFRAYFDESGTHDKKRGVFTLAGYVASAAHWRSFTREWRSTLRQAGFSRFHMVDFENRVEDFAGLTKSRAEALITHLSSIINRRVAFGVSFSVLVEDYNLVIVPPDAPKKWAFQSPYLLCLRGCLELISEKRNQLAMRPGERIACVFDRNFEMQGKVMQYYKHLKEHAPWASVFGGIAFDIDDEYLALDAADILAYETNKTLRNKVRSTIDRPERRLTSVLHSSGRVEIRYHVEGALTDLLSRLAEQTQGAIA
jgi:hypothetical protein